MVALEWDSITGAGIMALEWDSIIGVGMVALEWDSITGAGIMALEWDSIIGAGIEVLAMVLDGRVAMVTDLDGTITLIEEETDLHLTQVEEVLT
jgi:uncharacterized membrane protein